MNRKQKRVLIRIIVSALIFLPLFIACHIVSIEWYIQLPIFLVAYFTIGYDVLWKALKGIKNGQIFDENFLMVIATIGAFAIQSFEEAVAVMLFYQIGELFQSYAVGKSRRNIANLMDIRPDYANIIDENGEITTVDPDEVKIDSIIVVKPGEKIPLDGIILEGESSLNTSALTGESLPRDVFEGDEVISGCINISGLLKIKTTKEFYDSTVSKILDIVENASSKKSKAENFITKFARYYTPSVCIFAFLLALVPPIIRLIIDPSMDAMWVESIKDALTFLVISCPCALVISVPLTFFAGIGGASKAGILVKGSNYLETLSKAQTVVFDKTGTITKGVFKVVGIHHGKLEDEEILEYASLAEIYSNHPISKSLQTAYGKPLDKSRVKDVQEISGQGVVAEIDDLKIAVGNEKLMSSLGVNYIECHSVGTIVHVAKNNDYIGHIVISDVIKPTSKEAIENLKKVGVKQTIMLTGDKEKVASKVALELGIDKYKSELLPGSKVDEVEALLQDKSNTGKLCFVGDGINDAPVLSRADVGIAMGALGSDAAIEAADVVLMDDDPVKISKSIKIAKKCMRIVYQNIVFALLIKAICMALTLIPQFKFELWISIFADVGVMVLAVLNAIRALRVKKL